MPQLRAVVFDMDGTLIDSAECVVGAYQAAVAASDAATPTRQAVIDAYPLGPPRVILTHLLRREATADDEACYLERIRERQDCLNVYSGISEALTSLRRHSIRLGVFTGASFAAAEVLLDAADLLHHFEVVVGGDEVARAKPDPGGILMALDRLQVEPQCAAYVGDSPLDLRAATAGGTLAVAAAWGHLYEPGQEMAVVVTSPDALVEFLAGAFE